MGALPPEALESSSGELAQLAEILGIVVLIRPYLNRCALFELLQVEAIDKTVQIRRIDYTPVTSATKVAREALRERNQT